MLINLEIYRHLFAEVFSQDVYHFASLSKVRSFSQFAAFDYFAPREISAVSPLSSTQMIPDRRVDPLSGCDFAAHRAFVSISAVSGCLYGLVHCRDSHGCLYYRDRRSFCGNRQARLLPVLSAALVAA